MWNHWSLLQHIFFIKVQLKKVNLKIVFQRKYLKAHSQVRDNFWQLKVLYKLMKNAFHFTLKALFAIKIFKFLSWLFGYAKKWLDYKSTFNFKIYGKNNLAMKFGQLIEYNIFFLIWIHSMKGWTATARHGVTRKRSTKRLQHTGNLFRKNLQLKDVC